MNMTEENRKRRRRLLPGEPRGNSKDGLAGIALMTQRDAARIMGCSQQNVREGERLALNKIRHALRASGYRV
jgi:hypothetical protein